MPVPGLGADELLIERLLELEARLRGLENVEPVHVVGAAGEPAFQNGWVRYSATFLTPGFYRRGERVYLQGLIRSGTGALMFTLPKGYRPAFTSLHGSHANGAEARVDVDPNGDVRHIAGSNAYLQLDGISFRVA